MYIASFRTAAIFLIASIAPSLNGAINLESIAGADAIVVGTIQTRTESNENVSFDLIVTRTIKGGEMPSVLRVNHPWRRKVIIQLATAQQIDQPLAGIWSLKRTSADLWDALPVNGPDGLASSLFSPALAELPSSYQYPSEASTTDKIALELAAGVKFGILEAETLLRTFGPLSSPTINGVFSDFLKSSDVSVQAVGIAGLLLRKETASLSNLTQVFSKLQSESTKALIVSVVRDSVRDPAPETIGHLTAIANSQPPSPELRAAAIWALKAIHTKESLPFLATLLQSSDPTERMNAIIGLSAFANGCPPQTPTNVASMEYIQFKNPSPYRTPQTIAAFAFGPVGPEREAELVEFWTNWWGANEGTIAP